MYKPNHRQRQHQNLVVENPNFRDSNSWLSGDDIINNNNNNSSPTTLRQTQSNSTSGNMDPVLYNSIVEIVPLVESLIHRKDNSSFTRRGSVIYTKTPSRKLNDPKGRNASQSIPAKKKRERGDKDHNKDGGNNQDSDNFSIFSSRSLTSEKDLEELVTLREQLEDLQMKLAEKDELLKSAEISKNQMNTVHGKLDELKHQALEKDSVIKSTQLQLSDAKIKLADKQASLEKLQWEATQSNLKVDKLQEELESIQGDISSMMALFEELTNNESMKTLEDYDVKPHYLDYLPDIDYMDDGEMQKMEEARQAYVAAIATVKEKQDEESIAAAARARLHLHSFVLRPDSKNAGNDNDIQSGAVSPVSYRAYAH
ncbi:protein MICROTUBULE BINDING PROTEIN 2C [Mercurialis annua]|uniref:protein MICROTUBULE BINDING PROTEIN 2C n=1 Tax=Mercurialis annua TaxID=3986 RepID=UPI00215F5925|nr:protein MICROTUBULE BINDING PROTEIN 2C [Mercurialis annua]